MYKILISYRNWFRQRGEPGYGPFEELRDKDGKLILIDKADCARFAKDVDHPNERVKFEFVATSQ